MQVWLFSWICFHLLFYSNAVSSAQLNSADSEIQSKLSVIQLPFFCANGDWTDYYDRDNPGGFGDYETLAALRKLYPTICENPTAAHGRVVGTNIDATNDNGRRVRVDKNGLVCENNDQVCRDYEVRFCCPKKEEPYCPEGGWTGYYNVDNTGGRGDFELLAVARLEFPEEICEFPTAIHARRVSDKISWKLTGVQAEVTNKDFRCTHGAKRCYDFEVKWCCPIPTPKCGPLYWTDWFNRDRPSGVGDFETLDELRAEYPDVICTNPTAIDVQLVESGKPYAYNFPNIRADVKYGFSCVNEDGRPCEDYRVRFCCPPYRWAPYCRGTWTQFYDRDDPSRDGDNELFALLRKEYPEEICPRPLTYDVRIVGTNIRLPVDGQANTVSLATGFQCKNGIHKCCDYEIRFCCPIVPSEDCPDEDWTQYFDVDSPLGGVREGGDIEDIMTVRKIHPNEMCVNPTAFDARLLGGAHYTVANQNVHVSLNDGFTCYNDQQGLNEICCDYKVRYCCPKDDDPNVPCDKCTELDGKWTQFFDIDNPLPSTAGDDGDNEWLSEIRKSFPDVCEFPVAVEAQLLNGDDYTTANQVVFISTIGGFYCPNTLNNCPVKRCVNDKQVCKDYKVRFCCPDEVPPDGPISWCTGSGDPHYTNFDGKRFDFQGECTYYFAKTKEDIEYSYLHPFSVEVTNEHRGRATVTVLESATVRIGSDVIELRKGPIVVVNGIVRNIDQQPYEEPFFGYNIVKMSANDVRMFTAFGIIVKYDGNHIISVGAPAKYSNGVEGLCGNFNGDPSDDFALRGTDIQVDINSFGESYRTLDSCRSIFPPPIICDANTLQGYQEHCTAILQNQRCLRECLLEVDSAGIIDDCVFDACAQDDIQLAVRQSAETLFSECVVRDRAGCTLIDILPTYCPPGQTFNQCASACEDSCLKPNASSAACTKQCVPRCECPDGLVKDEEGNCIPPQFCPCLDEEVKFYLSPDCLSRCRCDGPFQVCQAHKCLSYQHCNLTPNAVTGECKPDVINEALLPSA